MWLVGLVGAATAVSAIVVRGRQSRRATRETAASPYAGSESCRECHERFFELWSTSHHGLAMQPFTPALAGTQLAPQNEDVVSGQMRYRANLAAGRVRESGPGGATKDYAVAFVMGGKNVTYLLTPRERGHLQVLPVAYDIRRKEWYDVAASGLRHFTEAREQAVPWTAPEFTFNTSCYGCHVSQLSSNYDLQSDTYRTTWAEPGINCETCHGPGAEHIRAAREAGPGKELTEPKLIVTKSFSHEQKNDLCASCHARLSPINERFLPGERYFDSFDLVGLESADFYPDGRDLGETYTFTTWRMSPCVKAGQLDCLHCHTSSGLYRFKDLAKANQACLPCHQERVAGVLAHSRHPEGKPGTACIECHMPQTEFARMRRTDHSMRPPAPAASKSFGSPNACNLCHQDKDAAWSERAISFWHPQDYQAPVIKRAALIADARKEIWSRLPEMLAAIRESRRDEVLAVSLIRLLRSCPSEEKWPVILAAMQDGSPWVRAAAAEAAGDWGAAASVSALVQASRDPVRLVRVRAAYALAGVPMAALPEGTNDVQRARGELEAGMRARPDDVASHHNLGQLLASRGERDAAIAEYETAMRLRPDVAAPHINVALLYNSSGRNAEAEAALRRALSIEPASAAAHLNLGLLLGELGRLREAEEALRTALSEDPRSAVAAYNLAVVASDRPTEAVAWSRRAAELDPRSPKYAFTEAFYLAQVEQRDEAMAALSAALHRGAVGTDGYHLLARLLTEAGRPAEARATMRQAAADAHLNAADRAHFESVARLH